MRLALFLALMLAACSDPRLNAGVSIGPEGVSIYPSLSGRVGVIGMTISP